MQPRGGEDMGLDTLEERRLSELCGGLDVPPSVSLNASPAAPPAGVPLQRGQSVRTPHQAVPPSIKLTRADAVRPRNVRGQCPRGQAVSRSRLLLFGRPTAPAFAARDQIHPKGRSALTTVRMCACC
jgi:hypothetical protein